MARIPKEKREKRRPRGASGANVADVAARLLARGRRRLPSVLRRGEIAALARVAARRGAGAWIVGGAARDLLLSDAREDPDVDFAVSVDPLPIAQDLAREGWGTVVVVSPENPRVVRVAGRREIDLARVEGAGIEQDLARRDFTVNAIAIALDGGQWLDPYGGIADLARKRLRAISESNLRDDPLRVLRGARLMATHGLSPDRATTAASRRAAPRLSTAAPERIGAELDKMLAADRVRPALVWAARVGALGAVFGRDIAAARGSALASRIPVDASAVRSRSPEERIRLRLAMLASRLGLKGDGDGDGDGSSAASWLASRRFSRGRVRDVAALIRLVAQAGVASEELERWRWVRDAADLALDALLLAGLMGALSPSSRAALARRVRTARRPPRVNGDDVQAWLKIAPGPRVGQALRDIEVEGLRGAIRTRAQARRWLQSSVLADFRTIQQAKGARGRL